MEEQAKEEEKPWQEMKEDEEVEEMMDAIEGGKAWPSLLF